MDIKFKPSDLDRMDSDVKRDYYSSMINIGKDFKPQFFRIKTYFQIPGSGSPVTINNKANDWFRGMLEVFKKRERNIKLFENFEVKFQDIHGQENIFNLSKNREYFFIDVDSNKEYKNKDIYLMVKPNLDQFLVDFYSDS